MIDKISEDILSKNVLIEASAGTGKTYTIVKLVANLIENAHALPEEIIIVTFTEKAAGEIKERIYNDLSLKLKEIDEEIRNNIDFEKEILLRKKKLINNALNNINKFLINTIHGFCNYLISNYAFEIGLNFTNEIIDDSEIIKNSFFSYLRKGLFEDIGKILNNSDKKLVVNFAEDIFSFLSFGQCTFENNNLIVDSSTEKKIYKILNYIYNISYIFPYKFRKYIFENSDEKYELLKDIGNKIDLIKIIFNKIKEFFADLKQNNQDREYTILYNFNEFVLELKDKFNDIINKINNYIEEIYPMLQDDDGSFSNNQNLGNIKKNIVDLISRIEAIERDINIHDFFSILEFKVKDSFPRYLQNKIFLFFYFLYTDILNSLVNYISINVFQLSLEYKKKCSKLSFNDMIHYVFNAINNSSILIDKLRNKFKYVFIDEFQDTDPIQWEIFRKIFISSENNNRVILIGDPKQSIYFFRNADLNTYFKAKNEIAKNGKIYKLDENFRSTAEFIDVCNKIFSSSDYFNLNIKNEKEKNISFSKNDLNIEYYRIKKGIKSKIYDFSIKTANNKEKYFGVNFVKIEKINNEGAGAIDKITSIDKTKLFLDFIGEEIIRITKRGKYLIKRENEKDYRYIKPSEIAILVSSRKDAIKIQNYLYDKFGIDSTFYKKNLLYQSVESINIYFLIDYISEPDNIEKLKKIILSDLFFIDDVENINIEEIINENENLLKFIDEVKKLDKIFLQWNFLSRIFKLMDVEKNIVRKYGSKRAKNIIINYRHIIENIEKIAYSENLDIFSLKNKFLAMIFKSKESEIEEDLFRNYSEEDKINILTIHASKGLEFPIVFDFGAIKKINNKKNYPFYYKNGNVVIEYKILKENKEMYLNKLLYEEYRRLHYVAITRAIFLAYIPIFFDPLKNNKSIKDIEEKKAKMSFSEYLGTLDILFDKNLEGAFIPCRSENIENSLIFEDKSPYNKFDNKIQENYVSIDFSLENYRNYILELNRKSLRLTSFSSLHEKEKNKNIYNIDKILKELNDEIYIKDFNLEETNLLPKGEKTGSMFHELMEEIDYDVDYDDKINNKELENIISLKISKYFSDYKYEQQKIFQENTKSMIKSVLNLKILEPNFYIKNIKKMDRVNELEFYFKIKNGFISGFIDLIFRVNINGKLKYFIADWKTNIVEGIDINKHFEENYFLQAKIYEFSFFKYILSLNNIYIFSFQDLKLNREKFFEIYNNYFGGIFYIYTREVEKRRNGVVFLNPNFERLYNFVEDIENVFN